MQTLYLLSCLLLSPVTSAWPHPDDVLEAVPDLGSVFDIFSWPATVEDAIDSSESAECPVDGTPYSDITDSNPLAAADDTLFSTGLFGGIGTVTRSREKAPPCGPDGTHHLVCCLDEFGAPGFLMDCRGGKHDGILLQTKLPEKRRAKPMMRLSIKNVMLANRRTYS